MDEFYVFQKEYLQFLDLIRDDALRFTANIERTKMIVRSSHSFGELADHADAMNIYEGISAFDVQLKV